MLKVDINGNTATLFGKPTVNWLPFPNFDGFQKSSTICLKTPASNALTLAHYSMSEFDCHQWACKHKFNLIASGQFFVQNFIL